METIQAYAFVSVFVSHAADGELANEELLLIRRNTHRLGRSLGYSTQDIEDALRGVVDDYWRLLDTQGPAAVMRHYQEASHTLAQVFQRDPRLVRAIRDELMGLAGADGEIVAMESFLINGMTKRWAQAQR